MIKASDIILAFAQRTTVPIDVEEVADEMRRLGVKDEFYVWEVELDDGKLRGKIAQWEPWDYPLDHDLVYVADVYIAKSMSNDWKRLVACKELLHVVDPDYCRVNEESDLNRLIERLVLPVEAHDPIKDGVQVMSDRFAIYEALAVLFSWEVRGLLLPLYKAGTMNLEDISRLVDLPSRYVSIVMSDVWAEIYPYLTDRHGALDAD